jgi:hypothetical protein
MEWVTIEKAAELSGYSPKAIEHKRESGLWAEGDIWFRAPDGQILLSVERIKSWADGGASAPQQRPQLTETRSNQSLNLAQAEYPSAHVRQNDESWAHSELPNRTRLRVPPGYSRRLFEGQMPELIFKPANSRFFHVCINVDGKTTTKSARTTCFEDAQKFDWRAQFRERPTESQRRLGT